VLRNLAIEPVKVSGQAYVDSLKIPSIRELDALVTY
jgi:hypothetical protein